MALCQRWPRAKFGPPSTQSHALAVTWNNADGAPSEVFLAGAAPWAVRAGRLRSQGARQWPQRRKSPSGARPPLRLFDETIIWALLKLRGFRNKFGRETADRMGTVSWDKEPEQRGIELVSYVSRRTRCRCSSFCVPRFF